MTADELIARARAQPVVAYEMDVHIRGPTLRALWHSGKHTLAELIDHPDQHVERQTFRHAHLLGPGLSSAEIERWRAAHAQYPLPQDLVEFLQCVNGVHLWADLASSRSYFGIAPLNEWQDAATGEWAPYFDGYPGPPPVAQLVISYHDNGDYLLIFDTLKAEYRWHDPHDFDTPKFVARSIGELLDCWWKETAWLDPRKMEGATEIPDPGARP